MSDITITESIFGKLKDGQEVKKYVLKNRKGFELSLISFGAAIQAIRLEDKHGKLTNVTLGFNTIEEYSDPKLNPYFGPIVGRVSNRISNGEFTLNGKIHKLEKNNGENCLHGGSSGFSWKNWVSVIEDNAVKFTLLSPDGDSNFPGECWVEVTYRISAGENIFSIEYKAVTDQPTPVDLTNHAYFNLAGEDSGEKIYDHVMTVNANQFLDSDAAQVMVKEKLLSVADTKFDFRNKEGIRLDDRIKANEKWPEEGYDNFFVINRNNEKGEVFFARIKNPSNGICLTVKSTQNGLQFYTSNFLDLKKPSNGQVYSRHQGFCMETQNYPDAINKPSFPSSIVTPEQDYYHKTTFAFSVEN